MTSRSHEHAVTDIRRAPDTTKSYLPRLAYISDVAVGDMGNGPKLLKCLLDGYPPEKLRLLVSDLHSWPMGEMLAGVATESFEIRWRYLKAGRLYGWMSTMCLLCARRQAQRLVSRLKNFRPEAIATVSAGSSWLTAAHVAYELDLPLHLILHDHLPTQCAVQPMFAAWMHRRFATVYRQATTRLCVSPNMDEFYHRAFGVVGTVLYPSRSPSEPTAQPVNVSNRLGAPFTVLYAGTVAPKSYVDLLGRLARVLESIDGRLVIYALAERGNHHMRPLLRPNVELRARVPSDELKRRFRHEADVLFVPMSFEPADEINMHISFPSKLADYTATGIPLLVWGPTYCSAIRWVSDFPGAAAVVDSLEENKLAEMLKRLKYDSAYRSALGVGALAAGEASFSQTVAWRVFSEALRQSVPQSATTVEKRQVRYAAKD